MQRGLLQQVASPSDLYEFPASRFVADFIGSVNLLEGALVVDEPDHAEVAVPGMAQPVFLDHGVTGAAGTQLWLALRPEKIELHKKTPAPPHLGDAPDGRNAVSGTITHIAYLGSESLYEVALESGQTLKALRSNLTRWDQEDFALGEPVWLAWHACSPAVLLT